MSGLGWIAGGVLGGLVLLVGSMVRIVPPEPAAPIVTEVHLPAGEHPVVVAHPVQRAEGAPVSLQEHALLTVPVEGVPRSRVVDTWGQSRGGGLRTHQGCDIMAPGGTNVVAAAPGTVEKLHYSNGGGGITLYLRSPDRRWTYYYAHLQGYAPGLHEGQVVAEGELLGYVGDTGNAGVGNFHLHFGISRMLPEEGWWKGQPVNPYPLLAGRASGG
jgi:murein DD-endopeptidase MepM/ murein hydrolase activator NlpD